MHIAIGYYGTPTDWFQYNIPQFPSAHLFSLTYEPITTHHHLFIRQQVINMDHLYTQYQTSHQRHRQQIQHTMLETELMQMIQSHQPYDLIIITTCSHILMECPASPGIYYTHSYTFDQRPPRPTIASIEIVSHQYVRVNGSPPTHLYQLTPHTLSQLCHRISSRIHIPPAVLPTQEGRSVLSQPYELDKTDITVLIPSVIYTSSNPFDYVAYRSLFSPHERFQQTLKQCHTIVASAHTQNHTIRPVVLEGSQLNLDELVQLSSIADIVLFCMDSDAAMYAHTHTNKSIYELYVMRSMVHVVQSRWIFKFGGRYHLLPTFKWSSFLQPIPVVKIEHPTYTFTNHAIVECVLYAFPATYRSIMYEHYTTMIQQADDTGASIETMLFNVLSSFKIVSSLNVCGRDAIEGFVQIL